MKRNIAIAGALSLIALLGGLYGRMAFAIDASTPENDFGNWAPNPSAIALAVRAMPSPASSQYNDRRHKEFSRLFQSRYRSHQPAMAIGMHFLKNGRIRLMCPARMEPWAMDELAGAAWHEAHDNFGQFHNIDIYETFIGTAPVKIGELRAAEPTSLTAKITYCYPESKDYRTAGDF